MVNKIILTGSDLNKPEMVISHLYNDLGRLLRIHGYRIIGKNGNNGDRRISIFSFRDGLHLPDIAVGGATGPESVGPVLIPLLSLFPNPDLFLIDNLGSADCSSPRVHRQLQTVFTSKIPVVATALKTHLQQIGTMLQNKTINIIDTDAIDLEPLYIEILQFLN